MCESARMTPHLLAYTPIIAAASWAFLTWILGGSAGFAVLVFVVLKILGK